MLDKELANKVDIVKVIKPYVKLKKTGRNYVGLCPFHSEKSPSFVISPERQIWHCFGCGKGGDIISFVMLKSDKNFKEALQYIAKEAKYQFDIKFVHAVTAFLKYKEKEYKKNNLK